MEKVRSFFAMFTDVDDLELPKWETLCENAGYQIANRLRAGVDLERNMERLCIAAGAVAYCDYTMLSGSLSPEEIRVGDISLKTSEKKREGLDAVNIRDYFIDQVSDLLTSSEGFAVLAAGCPL